MRRPLILSIIFLLLSSVSSLPVHARNPQPLADCDSLVILKQSSYGCTNFLLKNRNAARKEIDRFWLELVTPGLAWEGSAMVDNWNVVQIAPNILEISSTGPNIRPGVELTIGNACLSMVCQTGGDYVVRFKTFNQGNQICAGTVTLTCDALNPRDSLSVTVNAGNIDCYDLILVNQNSAKVPLNGLEITLLSPVGKVSGSSSNSWVVQPASNNTVRFSGGNSYVPVGSGAGGFRLCFSQLPEDKDTVTLLWKSSFNALLVTYDTLRLKPAREARCDSIVFRETVPGGDNVCFSATIFNLHEPPGAVTSLGFEMLNPGAIFPTGATGPWPLVQETPIFLRWATSGVGVARDDSLGGFSFCVINTGNTDTVRIRVTTRDGTKDICTEEYALFCPATEDATCDRFTSRRVAGDSYILGFVNRRRPLLSVNRLEMEILSSGIRFDSIDVPLNWIVETSEEQFVRTQTAVAVPPSASLTGFFTRFAFAGLEDSVVLRLCTSLGGQNACCDTIVLALTGVETRCDSLILERVRGEEHCVWRTGFVNTHLPASKTTGFRLTPLDENTTVAMVKAPDGWSVIADGSSGELYLTRAFSIEDSLSFDILFSSASGDSLFLFEWCTEDANGAICCGIDSVFCAPEARCDTLEEQASAQPMTRSLRILNRHLPPSSLDAVRIALRTAGGRITVADIPTAWTSTMNAAGDTLLLSIHPAIPSSDVSEWFSLTFSPAPGCDSIRYGWCTMLADSLLCCGDALPVACERMPCDTLVMRTDPFRPCCFRMSVTNGRSGNLDRVTLRILTEGVVSFPILTMSPTGWDAGSDTTMITWSTAGEGIPSGETREGFSFCFDNNAIGNADFRVLWETMTGRTTRCSDTLTISCDRTLRIEQLDRMVPRRLWLHQNYPNPFRSTTQLIFDLPRRETLSLQAFDAHGRLVASICDGLYDAGSYRVTFDAAGLSPGVYLLRLTSGSSVRTRMISLVR
ncbi:MAG: T9SS type A sorting domain-containing protein [Bacteroidetes bacterium]|nr:T9SS type A sorting domain-containing protein [Bacteroidota bacterium]